MIVEIIKNKKGVALLITILLMFLLFTSGIYFLDFALTEKKISDSQNWSAKTYYLAEAGINEMVWRLKNNATYKTNFETDPNWTQSFSRSDIFGSGSGSYAVTINNSDIAHGEIIASSTIDMAGGKAAQRVVKTYVYRATEDVYALGHTAGYADGNIDISWAKIEFSKGSAYSDNIFTVNGLSFLDVYDDLNAVKNFNDHWLSKVNITGDIHAANYPPAAPSIGLPALDFDSADADSYYNQADVIYSENDFDDLIKNNSIITLNDPITYVEGDVDLYGNKELIVNGLLVVERDFEVGRKWCRGLNCGRSSVVVNHTPGEPSGILAKRKIMFKIWADDADIDGILYAGDQFNISGIIAGVDLILNGGAMSRKFTATGVHQTVKISYDEEIATSTLPVTDISPTITVEHWEEEY